MRRMIFEIETKIIKLFKASSVVQNCYSFLNLVFQFPHPFLFLLEGGGERSQPMAATIQRLRDSGFAHEKNIFSNER